MTLLPLEEWLKHNARKTNEFPTNTNYFNRYLAQKEKFIKEVYPHVGAGLSAFEIAGESYVFYTDHGLAHVDAVIKTAGLLLGCKDKNSKITLGPYEVYLLLMCIISHDAGNIEGRESHQLRAYNLLVNSIAATLQDDTSEARTIHNIVVSHTAKGLAQPNGAHKDTISDLPIKDKADNADYRLRVIAAILRIADELCEDKRRLPRVIMDNKNIWEGDSAPYLRYANSIDKVVIDSAEGKVELRISLSVEELLSQYSYKRRDGSVEQDFLVDTIKKRLVKLMLEANYCFRFLRNVLEYPSISAKIEIISFNDQLKHPESVECITLNLYDEGYPNNENTFYTKYPDFDGNKLRLKNVKLEV